MAKTSHAAVPLRMKEKKEEKNNKEDVDANMRKIKKKFKKIYEKRVRIINS
jgi:hypothetical protein